MTDLEIRSEPDPAPENLDDATRAVNELRAATEEYNARLDERLATETRSLGDRLSRIETRLNRLPAQPINPNEPSPERRAFASYLRYGNQAPQDEIRALISSSDPGAGYLAPHEFSSEFIRNLVLVSPIRAIASVRSTGSQSVTYPTRTGITNATWEGETQTVNGSQPSFGEATIPTRSIDTFVDISKQLLEDSAGVVDREVNIALSEDFAQKEGLAFVKGAGPLQPEGILSNPNVAAVKTGNASGLPTGANALSDFITTFFYGLAAPYRMKGSWLMNSTTLAAIRTIKDSTGRYIWQPSLAEGQPETILGRPVYEIFDMDDPGAGTFPIVFGDIARAYRIVDRASMNILVDPYGQASRKMTRIYANRRVGGAVIYPPAIKKVVCAA
ncbi:phage major capsid protein [Methylocystis heyeri]|uniref:Phage major capsid protein n=1 Tax=Methylocystis heyeri TaxID=391905 RepID=A0A6B8KG96_9HYPH|nr:phage major capsid protein [Methylocystis heyeri]QGM46652.1 phage major capsid protein [Methylocystis heyeri]